MKAIKILFVAPLVIIALYLIVNQMVINSHDGHNLMNQDSVESKHYGLYLGQYIPTKATVKINSNNTVRLKNAWAEKKCTITHSLIFFERLKSQAGLNLLIPDTTSFFRKNYSFEPIDESITENGGIEKVGETFIINEPTDTIKFLIKCKKTESWTETVITDSVIYRRNF